jgi:hypothetical protein
MSSTQVALPPADEQRRRSLRIMRSVATGLLVFAALVFIWTERFAPSATWVSYVRAASEAAMVGAIADWFAVTAIFKHPLGIPIPHTALIPKGKDAIGRGLGEFIQGNFLAPGEVAERSREAQPAARLGAWLGESANEAGVATQLATVTRTTLELLKDDEVQDSIEKIVASRVRAIPLAPLLGGAIDHVMAEGRHHAAKPWWTIGTFCGLDSPRNLHGGCPRQSMTPSFAASSTACSRSSPTSVPIPTTRCVNTWTSAPGTSRSGCATPPKCAAASMSSKKSCSTTPSFAHGPRASGNSSRQIC